MKKKPGAALVVGGAGFYPGLYFLPVAHRHQARLRHWRRLVVDPVEQFAIQRHRAELIIRFIRDIGIGRPRGGMAGAAVVLEDRFDFHAVADACGIAVGRIRSVQFLFIIPVAARRGQYDQGKARE